MERKPTARGNGVEPTEQAQSKVADGATSVARRVAGRDYLDGAEVQAVLAAANDARARALLSLALGTGLRLRELCALRLGDLRPQADGSAVLVVRGSDARPDRRIRIGSTTVEPVLEYVAHSDRSWSRAFDLQTPLFIAWGRRAALSRCRASQIVAQALSTAGIRLGAHPLLLRRTFQRLSIESQDAGTEIEGRETGREP